MATRENIPQSADWQEFLTVQLCMMLYDSNLLLRRMAEKLPRKDVLRLAPLFYALETIAPEIEALGTDSTAESLTPAIMYLKEALAYLAPAGDRVRHRLDRAGVLPGAVRMPAAKGAGCGDH